jgi:hypothetical protein
MEYSASMISVEFRTFSNMLALWRQAVGNAAMDTWERCGKVVKLCAVKTYGGVEDSSTILDLCTSWGVVSFIPRSLVP